MVASTPAAMSPGRIERARTGLGLLRMAIGLVFHAAPVLTALLLLTFVVQALMPPLQLAFTAVAIDRLTFDLGLLDQSDRWATRLPLGGWIALTAGSIMLGQLLGPCSTYLRATIGDKVTVDIGQRIIAAVSRWHGLARFEDPSLADDLERARGEAATSGVALLSQIGPALIDVFAAVGFALTLARLHPLAPLAIIAAAIPHLQRYFEYRLRTSSALYHQTPLARQLKYTRDLMLFPGSRWGSQEVRFFDLGDRAIDRYSLLWTEINTELMDLRHRLARRRAMTSALADGVAGAVILLAVWRATQGDLTAGGFTLYSGAVLMLRTRLDSIGNLLGFAPLILAFLPALRRVLEAPPDLPVPAQPISLSLPLHDGLVFERVSFTYPGTDRPVLTDVSFRLEPGERLALVGHNGAGKTTIVKLLLRLYDPTEGRITLNGIDLQDYNPASLRRAFGVIFQDFAKFDLTARENIAAGDYGVVDDESRLLAAARKSGADSVLATLPDGLDTVLGRRFGDRDLSGGEWQKIALARAFVRDCPILVLDEPTASLDVRAEYEVYERFAELTRDRSTILISHRFSTVRMADRILVLEGGRVVESGTHADLMAQDALYSRLYTAQATYYVDSPRGMDGTIDER